MLWSTATITAYGWGQIAGSVTLGLLAAWLVLRALGLRSRRARVASRPASAWAPATLPLTAAAGDSVSLDGLRLAPQRERSGGVVVLAAALLTAAAIVAFATGAIRLPGDSSVWSHGQGAQVKAGFLASCRISPVRTVDCECAFTHLTAQAPYNTPAGFVTLDGPVRLFLRTLDINQLPPAYVSAATSCLRTNPTS